MEGICHRRLSALRTELDEAVVDPDRWPAFIGEASTATGSTGAILLRVDGHVVSGISTPSVQEATDRYFSEGWNIADHRLNGMSAMRRRGIAVDQDFTSQEQIATLPYYQDLLGRAGLRWFAGIGFQAGGSNWCLSLQRSPAQGYFDPGEQAALIGLAPALRRAAAISAATEGARLSGMTESLDMVGRAAAVIARDGRVIRHNEAFERITGEGFRIVLRRLKLHDPRVAAEIERLACALSRPALSRLAVRRRDGVPVALHAIPLSGPTRHAFSDGTLLLLASVPGQPAGADGLVLMQAYGMTRSECRLVGLLCRGMTLTSAAAGIGVAHETVRSQLRSVFSKVGVGSQIELVAELAPLLHAAG